MKRDFNQQRTDGGFLRFHRVSDLGNKRKLVFIVLHTHFQHIPMMLIKCCQQLGRFASPCLDVDESFPCAKPYVNVLTAGQLTEEFPLGQIFVSHRNGWFVLGHTAERSIWGAGSYIDPKPQTSANCHSSLLPIVIKICTPCLPRTIQGQHFCTEALESVYFQLIVCCECAGFIPVKNKLNTASTSPLL